MDLALQLFLWASIQLAATMSPGPAFIVSVKNALTYNRTTSTATAIGLALGISVHVTLVLTGMSLLLTQSPLVYNIIKYAGAAYLVYIGVKSLMASYKTYQEKRKNGASEPDLFGALNEDMQPAAKADIPSWPKSVFQGFLVNALNPKALVFFTAVLSQFISPDMTPMVKLYYGLISVMIEGIWFTFVGFVLTHPTVRQQFINFMHWIEGIFGGLIVYLGVKLASAVG